MTYLNHGQQVEGHGFCFPISLHLRASGCDLGGYYTYEPTCIRLRVTTATESAEVGIPVGMVCPAQ